MSRNHTGGIRQFTQYSRAYFHKKGEPIAVQIGVYQPNDGTSGEFLIEWEELTRGTLTPRLKAYDDGWSALMQFQDLLKEMAERDSEYTSEEEFCDLLRSLGIEDATPTEKPY